MEQGVGVGWKKGILKGVTLHIIWGIFKKYRNWGLGGVEFGKFGGYLCMFKSMRWRGSHRAYPGGGGPYPRGLRPLRSETIQNPRILAD